MERYALTGYPLGHSVSPEIHRKLFALSGREGCAYTLLPIPPETFSSRFSELAALDGFNVTVPHKQTVIPFLDGLDPSAERYRAVNVVRQKNGRLTGYNTDVTGFLKSVERLGQTFPGKRVLVLGYGGAGRMTAAEAAFQGAAAVRIAAREKSFSKARTLAEEIAARFPGCDTSAAALDEVGGGYDLIVNTTPCGMFPHTDESPLEPRQLAGSAALFDAVYNPGETKLMRGAREKGLAAVGGMTMLVWQAAEAHRIWYGASFDPERIEAMIREMEAYVTARFKTEGDR